jgi:hypothetical protein
LHVVKDPWTFEIIKTYIELKKTLISLILIMNFFSVGNRLV